ncbi:MAG TPA: hypothetical protein VGW10_00715, partial [Solirubrobacteraceae bacterium]|nr:hypothetical protein [Solirubrobacteraceae bacterium]
MTAAGRAAAVPRLLEAGVLSHEVVVDRGVTVEDWSRANEVLLVRVPGAPAAGAVVKAFGEGERERLDAELRVHALAEERPGLRRALPALLAADAEERWLALEAVVPGV